MALVATMVTGTGAHLLRRTAATVATRGCTRRRRALLCWCSRSTIAATPTGQCDRRCLFDCFHFRAHGRRCTERHRSRGSRLALLLSSSRCCLTAGCARVGPRRRCS
jgi:hypothetical protein